jgi:UDP-4-amino-4,6-dideoxy-N-acetyl-beta-L-altrosamine transaminase
MPFIPYGRQSIDEEDIAAVVDVLKSDFITQGPAVPAFEARVAQHCGVAHAVAVCNATAALHIACLALGVGPGDTVWTSPNTFVASANCARYCGADVDFVDIDPATWNMSVTVLAEKLTRAERAGRLPKVLIPVHLCGQSCDMAAIHDLARRYGVRIIEDASHAIGARYRGEPVGSCRYSDISVFSFHPVKIITTGEGGMAVTNDPLLARRMELLRSHGITREPAEMTHEADGPWYYQQVMLGYNYRITDIQAALGASQMRHLEKWISRRNMLAARYNAALADSRLLLPKILGEALSAFHLYVVVLERDTPEARKRIFEKMRKDGIGVNLHYIPVHLQPDFEGYGFKPGDFPEAESYYRRAISLPMFAALREEEQDYVIDRLKAHCAAELN